MPPAAAGEAGVAHLLRLFAEDMKVTMTLTGATSPSAISLDCLDRLEQDQHRTHAVPVSYPPDAARDPASAMCLARGPAKWNYL